MILKKHLPLNSKYFTVLGLAMLPAIVLAQPKVVDKVDKTEGTMQVAPTASMTRYQPKHINAPKLRGAASFNYSLDDTGATKVRDARKYGDWRFQAFKLGLEGDVQGLGYHVDYAWFRSRMINVYTKNDTNTNNTYNHFLEAYASHKFHNGVVGQIGNTLVPFGNSERLTYWQNIPFYAGFGENYQTGFKMIYKDNPWKVEMQLGKNNLISPSNANSYAPKLTTGIYDLTGNYGDNITTDLYNKNNEDSVQLTAKVTRSHQFNEHSSIELALSGKFGNTYNTVSTTRGTMWAGALHVNGYWNNWILQAQYLPYRYSPDFGDTGVDRGAAAATLKDTMQLGKDGVLYTIPTKASIVSFGLGYKIPLSWDHIKTITVYDDYSILSGKTTKKTTKLNIVGFKFKAGPLWVNAEAVVGKNMIGIGQGSVSVPAVGNGYASTFTHINNIGGDGYNVTDATGAAISPYNDNIDHWKTKFNIHMAIKF